MLYANTVCHHGVLPGSVSRVGLMVRCFKNSLSVRTENKWNAPLHNLITILWASRKLPAVFYKLTIERMFLWEPTGPSLYTSLFIFNSYMYNTCSTIVPPLFCTANPPSFSVSLVFRWTAVLWKAWSGGTTPCLAASQEIRRRCLFSSSRAQRFLRSRSWPAPAPSTNTPAFSSRWPLPSSTWPTGTFTCPRRPWRKPGTSICTVSKSVVWEMTLLAVGQFTTIVPSLRKLVSLLHSNKPSV